MKKIDKIFIMYTIYMFPLYHLIKLRSFQENEFIISFIRDFSILFIVFLIFLRNIRKIRMAKISWVLTIVFSIQVIIAVINGGSMLKSIYDIRYYIIWPSLIYFSYNIITNRQEYYKILETMKNISLLIGILGMYFKSINYLDFLSVRFGDYGIKSILPTHIEYGLLMFLGCAISMYLQLEKSYKKNMYISIVEFIIFTIGVYFSFSRLTYLAYISFFIIFLNFKIIKNKIIRVSCLLLELSLAIVVMPNFFKLIDTSKLFSSESFLDRIYSIWLKIDVSNALIGNGFGSIGVSNNIINSQFDLMLTDNLFIRIYYNLGLLGLVTIILLAILLIVKSNKNIFLVALIISLAIAALFGDLFTLIPVIPYVYVIFGAILKLEIIKEHIN